METRRPTPAYQLILTLGVAGFLSGLIIVGVYEWTLPKVLAHQAEALRLAVLEVLPGSATMRPLVEADGVWQVAPEAGTAATGGIQSGEATSEGAPASDGGSGDERGGGQEAPRGQRAFAAFDASGQLVGYAFEGEGAGFQDVIRLLYGFDPKSRRVVGMRILESRETPGLGDKIYKDAKFVANFDALAVDPAVVLVKGAGSGADHEVHAITGATISSRAVVGIVSATQARWDATLPALAPAEKPSGNAANAEKEEHGDR